MDFQESEDHSRPEESGRRVAGVWRRSRSVGRGVEKGVDNGDGARNYFFRECSLAAFQHAHKKIRLYFGGRDRKRRQTGSDNRSRYHPEAFGKGSVCACDVCGGGAMEREGKKIRIWEFCQ